VSPSIRGSDAEAFDRVVGRRVVVWDNYPVNDYTGGIFGAPTDLHQGPVMGRGPDLVGRVRGLLANPMAEWQTNKVPLATVADDLNDPYHYQPETSWRRALTEFGGSNASWLAKLAENTRSSPLGQAESVVFAPLTLTFTTAYAGPDWPAPADALDRELTAEQISPDRLTVNGFQSPVPAAGGRLSHQAQVECRRGAQCTRPAKGGAAGLAA
jgi:hyaluronoglucosaminidase